MSPDAVMEIISAITPNENGCRIWNLPSYGDRYPIREIDGRLTKLSRLVLSRKLGRPILPGKMALHTCDVKMCLEQTHLYEGTHSQNMQDAKIRNRIPRGSHHHKTHPPQKCGDEHYTRLYPDKVLSGSKNGNAKLTEGDVREMRRLHSEGIRQADLIRQFAVSQGTVNSIIRGTSWRHVK